MRWVVLIAILLVAGAVGVGFFAHARQRRAQLAAPQPGARVVTIPVEGMSCVSCAATVRKALQSIDGVTGVEVSLEHRAARVQYIDGKVSPDQLVAAVNHLGYRAGAPEVEETK